MPIIEVKKVSKKFKQNSLYEEASLNVDEGKTVGIVGGNGVGKSVLFKMITGLEFVDSGEIMVRNKMVGKNCDFPKNVGIFVNQPGYIDFYNGFTNLKLLAEIQDKISDDDIKNCMKKVGLNPEDSTRVKNYSAGMKQKLGIAQAIMENQDIVLLDEPFNALDFQTNKEVMGLLMKLKEEGKTIMLTSHQHEYLEKICDEIYMILNKKIVLFDEELKRKYFSIFEK
ncbi:MAG: ATP-binding cassette domain-containing protein [Tissierellia bacterium]|nr:ATP-binding cassette domain-containing protein [Tissierellia bacterium]